MNELIAKVFANIPLEFIVSVIVVVTLTEFTKTGFAKLEKILEEKKGKEIKFFDHTKIIFVIIYSVVASILLVVAGIYTWRQLPLYAFAILGVSVTSYETVLKRFKSEKDEC